MVRLTIYTALIEWTDDLDPSVFTATTQDEAERIARKHVEWQVGETVETWLTSIRSFVLEHKGDDLPFEEWYTFIHEAETVPWITITEHEIEVPQTGATLESLLTSHEPTALFFREAWASGTTESGVEFSMDRTVGGHALVFEAGKIGGESGPLGGRIVETIKISDLLSAWLRLKGIEP